MTGPERLERTDDGLDRTRNVGGPGHRPDSTHHDEATGDAFARAATGGAELERPDANDPTDRFLQEVAEIRLKGAGRDALLLKAGAAMMPLGVLLSVMGWFLSRNSQTSLDQNDALIVSVIGVTVAVVGVGLFLRYSLAEFLRFWLARMIHQQDLADRARYGEPRRPSGDGPS